MDILIWYMIVWPLVAEWGKGFWVLDLFNHFRIQMGLTLAGLAGVLLLAGRPLEAAGAGAGAFFCGASVWERAARRRETAGTDEGKGLSILTCNVWLINKGHESLARLIRDKDPDVVVLLETDRKWFEAMREPLAHYQHHKCEPREDFFGLAVYSKYPMAATVEHLAPEAKPSIRCHLYHPDGDLALWCLHPAPPFTPRWAKDHRATLGALADRIRGEGLPVIVTGDLNTSPWARNFRESLAFLKDAGAGHGLATTWPAILPAFLRIPIDHLLHTGHFNAAVYEVLSNMGSDHKPIHARLTRRSATRGS